MVKTSNIVLLSVCVGVAMSGCRSSNEPPFAGSGIIEATEVTVSSQSQGELLTISFKEGYAVTRGQLLAEIDVEHLTLSREAASADLADLTWNEKILKQESVIAAENVKQAAIVLDNARKNFDRIDNLFHDNAVTKDSHDKAETELLLNTSRLDNTMNQEALTKTRLNSLIAKREKIEANLRLLDKQIADAKVLCPIDGVILEKYREQGEIVTYGSPICKVANMLTVWLYIYIGEEMLGKVTLGGKADVSVDSHPGNKFTGVISWISPKAEFTPKNVQTRDSRVDLVYAVKITLDNPEGVFKIGMPVDVFIEGF